MLTPTQEAERLVTIFTEFDENSNSRFKDRERAKSRANTHCKLILQLPCIILGEYRIAPEKEWQNYNNYWEEVLTQINLYNKDLF